MSGRGQEAKWRFGKVQDILLFEDLLLGRLFG